MNGKAENHVSAIPRYGTLIGGLFFGRRSWFILFIINKSRNSFSTTFLCPASHVLPSWRVYKYVEQYLDKQDGARYTWLIYFGIGGYIMTLISLRASFGSSTQETKYLRKYFLESSYLYQVVSVLVNMDTVAFFALNTVVRVICMITVPRMKGSLLSWFYWMLPL